MGYRLVATQCKDGDCPSIRIDDEHDGDVIVRGPDDADSTTERDIRITAVTWRALLASL